MATPQTPRMTPLLMDLVAERFRVLGEPMRLRILDALRQGERTVGELVEATEGTQANVSRHLTRLHALGFVTRRKEATCVYYRVADPEVYALCDLVCGGVRERAEQQLEELGERRLSTEA